GARRDRVPLHIHLPNYPVDVDRGLVDVPYCVPGDVRLDLRAWYPHAEYRYPQGHVCSRSARSVYVVVNDQERPGDILWFARLHWHGGAGKRNDRDCRGPPKHRL